MQFNPRVENEILVTPMRHAAVVVTLPKQAGSNNSAAAAPDYNLVPLDDENDNQIVASYDTKGKRIYTGNSRGKITIYACNKKDKEIQFKLVSQFKVTQQASTAVKGIEFSRRGGSFLVNTADRVIRVYKTADVLSLKDGK